MRKYSTHVIRFFFWTTALLGWGYGWASIRLPALFSDGMVLQQKTKLNIWGWSSPGEKIMLAPSWHVNPVYTNADLMGRWTLSLQTPPAGGPYSILLKGQNAIEIKDVLIGEVWLCSGQSNMTFPLKYSSQGKEEISKADYATIRYFGVKRQYGPEPLDDCAGSIWTKASSPAVQDFSAVAFHFAKELQRELKIPIGIVCSAWSGTPAEAWTPRKVLEEDASLRFFLQRWKEIPQKVGADSLHYLKALKQWQKNHDVSAQASLEKPAEPRTYYYFSRPWCEPGALFNGMINPLVPFTVKGIVWYQGESNVSEADRYEQLFITLIRSWRQRWKNAGREEPLPFYFVQVAPFLYNDLDAAARLREAQQCVATRVRHTAMAVTMDAGDMSNIHPARKEVVGKRLALIALARSYGFKNMIDKGPACTKISKKKGRLILHFDQPLFTIDQQAVDGFEIGYKNKGSKVTLFKKAQAAIKGNNLIVWNNEVPDPLCVRYGWLEVGGANVINESGLPAGPFRRTLLKKDKF